MGSTRIKDRGQRISRNPASKPVYQRRMLEALAHGLTPRRAAEVAGVGRSTAYLWRQEDPEFAAKWDDAVAESIDLLETVAYQRAVDGDCKLLIFILERRRPEVWGRSKAKQPNEFERSHEAPRKVLSLEEAQTRLKQLGLPVLEIEGDYDEIVPRERESTPEK